MVPLKKLIREIHERSVWQVLTVYLVGSWAALQAVDTLVGVVGLPEWFPGLAVALVILGLPMVLATAIVQEGVGPRAEARTRGSSEGAEEVSAGRHRLAPDGESGVGESGVRAHHIFTWRNAALGAIAAFALWGGVAAAADSTTTTPSGVLSVETFPRPASVVLYRVRDGGVDLAAGERLGTTPVTDTVAAGEYLVRLIPTTGDTTTLLARVPAGGATAVERTLSPVPGSERGMVFVPAGRLADELARGPGAELVEAFLMDRYEVTNAEFAAWTAPASHPRAPPRSASTRSE